MILPCAFHDTIRVIVSDPATPDLSLRQLDALLTIAEAPKPGATVRGLAADLNVSKPAITRAADRLSELGYVTRNEDKADKRSVLLRMTPAGRKFIAKLPQDRFEARL